MDKVNHAFSLIKGRIEAGEWNNGKRMPSLGTLALECSVSRMTVWRVVGQLKKEGLIQVIGRAIICGKAESPLQKKDPAKPAWERVKDRIGYDILSGSLAGKNLPSIKALALTHRAAIKTVRKALADHVREGLLVRTGRTFTRSASASPVFYSTIVLVSQGGRGQFALLSDPRTVELSRQFERECPGAGFSSHIAGFNADDADGLIAFSASLKKIRRPAGFIINLWSPYSETQRQRWLDLIRFLLTREQPVIVIDQEGSFAPPLDFLHNRYFRVLRIAGKQAGEMMARVLLNRGFYRPVFISPQFTLGWVKARFEGFSRYFKNNGASGTEVLSHSLPQTEEGIDLALAALDLGSRDLKNLYWLKSSPKHISTLLARLNKKDMRRIKAFFPDNRIFRTIHSFSRATSRIAAENPDPEVFDLFFTALETAASSRSIQQYRAFLFEKMTDAGNPDVWVCSDDQTAYDAIGFLKSKGRKVPDDISVTGFDDWRESLEMGLTTYNFNMAGMIQKAMVLIKDKRYLSTCLAVSEVDGYVVERRTTRR